MQRKNKKTLFAQQLCLSMHKNKVLILQMKIFCKKNLFRACRQIHRFIPITKQGNFISPGRLFYKYTNKIHFFTNIIFNIE